MKAWWTLAAALLLAAPVVSGSARADDPPQAGAPAEESDPKADGGADAKPEAAADEGEKKGDPEEATEKGLDLQAVAHSLQDLFGMQRFGKYQKNHDTVRDVFKTSIQNVRQSTAAVVSDDELVALGAIVDSEGLIVSKASELKGDLVCRLADGKEYQARVVATDAASDVAMLKIEASGLPAVEWADGIPEVGAWLATAGLEERPLAVGVVSVAPRDLPAPHAVLGVFLDEDPAGVRINRVLPDSGAEEAGVLVNDVVQAVNGETVTKREELVDRVKRHSAGDRVLLKIKRGDESIVLGAILKDVAAFDPDDRKDFQNTLGGRLSERRGGFTGVLQHDTVLKPQYCGGPICDLDGKVVGINICRAGRVESYALTSTAVRDLLAAMKAGENSATAAEELRKADVQKLVGFVDDHLATLEKQRVERQASLDQAKKSLEEAEKALAAAESAEPKVDSDVAAAKSRVEEAKGRVKDAEKAAKAIESSIETTKRESETLQRELSGLTRS